MAEGFQLIFPNESGLVMDREGICQALLTSMQEGTIVGVNSSVLGKGTFLISPNGMVAIHGRLNVVFNQLDCAGNPLKVNTVMISEIRSIYPFKSSCTR